MIEVASGKERAWLPNPDVIMKDVRLATDGRLVAYTDQPHFERSPIRVWDALTYTELRRFQQNANVCCLAFSPDGSMLASGLADSTTLIWDLIPFRNDLVAARLKRHSHGRAGTAPITAEVAEVERERNLVPSEQELEKLWANVAADDARKAFVSINQLAACQDGAVSFLGNHLRPAEIVDSRLVHQLIEDLDSNLFRVRDRAERDLARLGARAAPALQRALTDQPSAEVRRRVETLLNSTSTWHFSWEELRALRAVEVLERIGSNEACRLLERISQGAAGAHLTRDAKASLARLAVRR